MKITAAAKDGQLTLFLAGELDHHAAKKTMAEIERQIDTALPRDLVLDMTGLPFMDKSDHPASMPNRSAGEPILTFTIRCFI